MLETLYFYALAHQNDFDVCWPKGSIAELIFTPLVERIGREGGCGCVESSPHGGGVVPATHHVARVH